MTTATQAPNVPVRTLPNRPDMVSVGTMVWLTSELMFFAGLFGWSVAALLTWIEGRLLAWNRQSDD